VCEVVVDVRCPGFVKTVGWAGVSEMVLEVVVDIQPPCHSLVAATGYLDLHFPCRTADSSFSISDLISSPLPIVVARYFFTLPVPSPSFLLLPSPSGTFRSRSLYVPLPSGSFCTLPMCSG
jgi:hypothetical protein